jgi:glycosyltransferase involved in cell wall biosynthesis
MAIDLSTWAIYLSNKYFLFYIFLISLVGAWIYLFFISLRAFFATPSINPKKCPMKNRIDKPLNSCPFVSVIVPARNEQYLIKRCLLSILSQDYINFEVIVIDDNSTDDTLEVVKTIKNEIGPSLRDKLRIISLSWKPEGWWSGKAWACEQGYLKSQGDLLLFTDADTYYNNKNTLSLAVSYIQNQRVDVLTGNPHIELPDFWSKVSIPWWNHFAIILGEDTAALNNPRSDTAYLLGSFFMIYKSVLKDIKGFIEVRKAIHEDVALGMQLKKAGYNIKIVKLYGLVTALWSRDLPTLWNGIRRTLAPMSKSHVVINFLTIFLMSLFPFLFLLYTLPVCTDYFLADIHSFELNSGLLFFLNIASCLMIIVGTALKDVKRYRISPVYSLLALLGVLLIMAAYIANMIPLLISDKPKSISWRGRKLLYKQAP